MINGLNQNINTEKIVNDKSDQEILEQQKKIQAQQEAKYNDPIRQIEARFLNFSNSTKWLFYIPIGYIFQTTTKNGQNLQVPINCRSVKFPAFRIGSTQLGYMGYGFDFSTRQNLTQKGLTIQYIVNQQWFQYMMLLKWFEQEDYTYYTPESNNGLYEDKTYNKHGNNDTDKIIVEDGNGLNSYKSTQGPMVPCNLYLMDNFNNRVCSILFQNCWLTNISQIDLSYAKTSNTEIEGSFELKFSKYSLTFNSDYLKKMFQTDGISKETL